MQVRALEAELSRRLHDAGLDQSCARILVVTRLIPEVRVTWRVCDRACITCHHMPHRAAAVCA